MLRRVSRKLSYAWYKFIGEQTHDAVRTSYSRGYEEMTSYIYIYIYISTTSFVCYGPARQVYSNNRTTNNWSIDKTDNKPFMQYLLQKRHLHRIEFSNAREKHKSMDVNFFYPCSANPK